jgi:hypothetical protein
MKHKKISFGEATNGRAKCLISVEGYASEIVAILHEHQAGPGPPQKNAKKISISIFFFAKLCVYGRLRCRMAKQNAPPRRSRRYVWSAEAVSIAQKKQHPVRSCEELIALTGHNKAACWRFLNKHGVERPAPLQGMYFLSRWWKPSRSTFRSTACRPRASASIARQKQSITSFTDTVTHVAPGTCSAWPRSAIIFA